MPLIRGFGKSFAEMLKRGTLFVWNYKVEWEITEKRYNRRGKMFYYVYEI